MTQHDDQDRRIAELFSDARRADETSAPAFHAVIHREQPTKKQRRLRWFSIRPAFAIATSSFAVVAFAMWIAVQEHTLDAVAPAVITFDSASEVAANPPEPITAPAEVPVVPTVETNIELLTEQIARAEEDSQVIASRLVRAMPPPPRSKQAVSGKLQADAMLSSRAYAGDGPRARQAAVEFERALKQRASYFDAETEQDAPGFNTESYAPIQENDFLAAQDNPLSTFSIDVDTASYTNVRRFLNQGRVPPLDAVRIEELINYFRYDYPLPDGDAPFSATVEVAGCPWNPDHRLARIGLRGKEVSRHDYRGSNLVFLLDVSGSMQPANKLPLLKSALAMLVDQLDGRDQVAIVVYAGSSGLVLPSISGDAKSEILDALDNLQAGGSTNGGSGLRLAYRVARDNFIPGGVNRVILATDGDFNVGVTSKGELLRTIEDDARNGIFLTALGFGMGNYKDDTLEMLADRGNGNYAYIDSLKEARRVLVEEIGGTLVTIAKDVKIQVEFNPLEVGAYRLIGYENRKLNKEDFNDDRKDAGEIGSGHTVTALYEIVPPDVARSAPSVDPLKYRQPGRTSRAAKSGELFTLKLRYKEPEEDRSRLLSFPVTDDGASVDQATADFKFAASVAMFGMILRDSEHRGEATLERATDLALAGMQRDARGLRAEFRDLVERAGSLRDDSKKDLLLIQK